MDEARIASIADKVTARSRVGRFPPKALDYNRVEDADGFWSMSIKDAKLYSGASLRPDDIGDLIFFLNMAAQGWERKNG